MATFNFYVDQIARKKICLFHLILEICKSSFLHSLRLGHVGTYAFRKLIMNFWQTCGTMRSLSSFWETWLNQDITTFYPLYVVFSNFLGFRGTLVVFPAVSRFCTIIGLKIGTFWLYSWLAPNQCELGVSSSIPSLFLVSRGQSRVYRFHS